MQSIDFVIPAHDEQDTLGNILRDIVHESFDPPIRRRFLIATGEQATEQVVQDFKQKFPLELVIHLTNATHGGKIHALNQLFTRIESEIIFMSDADIQLVPGSLQRLYRGLVEHPEYVASVGCIIPLKEPLPFPLNYFLEIYAKREPFKMKRIPHLNGRLYAIRSTGLPKTIPSDVIMDDTYIGLHLKPSQIYVDTEALAFMHYFSSMREFLGYRIRLGLGRAHLKKHYGNLLRERSQAMNVTVSATLNGKTYVSESKLVAKLTKVERLMWVLERGLIALGEWIGSLRYRATGVTLQQWKRLKTTKRAF